MYAPKPMADILVRPVEDRDYEGLFAVWSLTYNNGDPYPQEKKIASPGSRSFVVELNGQIAAGCNVLDLTASRGPATLACGGVAAVAVLPEMRRSGVGSAMLGWLVSYFRENGTPLASLYAYREKFYRKFGYEVAGRRSKVVCPTNRWPKIDSDLPVRRLSPGDWEQLVPCYTSFARSRSGLNLRTKSQWQRVLGENRQLTIYAVGDPIEAYAVVSHSTSFWTTDHISELVWSTRAGYEGILSMLGGLAINKHALSWFEPSDGPFYTDYLDQGIEVSLDRPIMFRVNDVPGALASLKPDPAISGEFILEVADDLVAANNGPWNVQFKDGNVSVERTSLHAGITLDIRNFAQAFLGEPSIGQLAAQGRVSVTSQENFRAAQLLLTPSPTYCIDFF